MIKYQWKGRRYNPVAGTYSPYVTLSPIYGDKVSIKHSMPDDERYYKESFNGTLTFVREDFFWIMSKIALATRFEVVYELELHAIEDNTDQLVTTLKFTITDCEIDEDNGIAKVKPTTKTRYDEVLDGLDREFNLVELNPVIEELTWYKRPVVQLYADGDSIVTNFLGTTHWEQEASPDGLSITQDCHFATCGFIIEVTVTNAPNYNGKYRGKKPINVETYDIRLTSNSSLNDNYIRVQRVWDSANNLYRVYFDLCSANGTVIQRIYSDTGDTPESFSVATQSNGRYVERVYHVYGRILSAVSMSGSFTRPTNDIVPYNKEYGYVTPYAVDCVDYSLALSTTPTPYGRVSDEYSLYYYPPTTTIENWLPVQQSEWKGQMSVWYNITNAYINDGNLRKKTNLRHAYPLYSAIKVLLAQIAPNISFNETTDYSQFLFDYNRSPVGYVPYLFITPKTNILNGDYKTPAYKAPIKLKEILEMLKQVYKCYWFIDDSNRLRIEHISWFMNGGTYSTPSPVVSYNLTTMFNSRNGKRWSMDTQHYTFDKPNMPNTYTFGWMDEVSQEFEGYQMEMSSCFVEKGKNDEINVSKFTTDIDFVSITPDDISKDGFMLLGADYDSQSNTYSLAFYSYPIANLGMYNPLQNGYLAFVYLEKTAIWLTDLPARSVSYADGTTASVVKQRRLRQQDVTVPMTTPIFNPMTLIQSSIGAGEVKDIEINLSSLTAKAKLHHDIQ